jgi:hypothetical protein
LLKTFKAIASGLERIIPNRAAAVQTVFNYSGGNPGFLELKLNNAWPSLIKPKPRAGVRNDAPTQGIRVNQNLMHWQSLHLR